MKELGWEFDSMGAQGDMFKSGDDSCCIYFEPSCSSYYELLSGGRLYINETQQYKNVYLTINGKSYREKCTSLDEFKRICERLKL
jgi:hypothetical protein